MTEENNTEQNTPGETTPDDTKKTKKRRNSGEAFETDLAVGRNTLKLSADDPGLKADAASVGYDAAAIAQGQAYFDALNEAYEAQKTAFTAQLNAHTIFLDLMKVSRQKSSRIVQALRLVLRDDPKTLANLKPADLRKKAYGPWSEANRYFFNRLGDLPAVTGLLAGIGVPQAMIDEAKLAFNNTQTAETAHKNARAEAQRATAAKNDAYMVYSKWMNRYINVLAAALVDDPQMREKLGIVAH
ncbi:MAG: hypothetical protein NT166_20775 [Candidatus Aminicenantes bacterium]|nr:hypothetical protein [Candidatus Aminicenantes bacterium]